MHGKTHLVIGTVSVLAVMNPEPVNLPVALSFGIIGALLPDIDIKNSPVRKPLTIFSLIIILYYFLELNDFSFSEEGLIGLSIILIFSIYSIVVLPHRTMTHSIIGLLLYSSGVGMVYGAGLTPFMIGYISHMISDAITKAGIPIFYPIDRKRYGLRLIKTGDSLENIIFLFLLILLGFIYIKNYAPLINISL